MQEKIQQFAEAAIANKKIMFGALFVLVLGTLGVVVVNTRTGDQLAAVGMVHAGADVPGLEIATVRAASSTDGVGDTNSWPGELVSLGSVPVQPSREGTITSWNVYVGQKVYAGQVLGALSQPPAMPDTIAMLADEEKMVTMARVNADAKRAYVESRLAQLEALRASTERSLDASHTLLGTNTGENSGSANFSMIEAKKATIRAMLRGTLAKTYAMFSGEGTLPVRWTAITLKDAIGAQNSGLRDKYPAVLSNALLDLNTEDKLPIESGLAYFDLAIKLVDTSIPDNAMLTADDVAALKTMLHDDQEAFIMAIDKLRESQLMASDAEKMSFEQLRMIDNDIAMLKQDLAMAEGDVSAKEASYRTVRTGVVGGSAIIAGRSGTISSILKKPGEFVMPGTPVAVITGTGKSELFVRMRLPSNIKMPVIGEIFGVVRTGFPQDVHKAKLIGIGNAIDETGSVMADAILLDGADWPVGSSLRVLAPRSMKSIEIKLSALWFDAGGRPNVWAVSSAGRVYAKPLTIGRTVGAGVEVYEGLVSGDRYIVKPTAEIAENMLIDDVVARTMAPDAGEKTATQNPHAGHAGMPGMEM